MNGSLENGTVPFMSSVALDWISPAAFPITALAINLILVLPSNIYVMWLILSGAGGTIASEFFYLNLTASMIISTLGSVFYFAWFFTRNSTLITVSFFTCVVFFWFSVPSFQCCVCVERYMAVVHPVAFLGYKALRYRVACCCVVWLTAIALSSFLFLSPLVMIYVFLGLCAVSISVLSFCCLAVLRALKQPGPGEGQRDSGKDMKRRAFRIILISLVVMVLTLLSYVPCILSILLDHYSEVANLTTYILVRLSGFAHPLLYIHKAGKLPCSFKGL